MPPLNPTVEGPVKSLRQVAPGGDLIPGIFAAIAALLVLGTLRNPPGSALIALVDLALVGAFAVPAYLVYAGARGSGLFVTEDAVERRTLGRVRESWKLSAIKEISPMSGGVRVIGLNGFALRELRFRWWSTEQVSRFATATGLGPPTAVELLALSQVNPGEPGKT